MKHGKVLRAIAAIIADFRQGTLSISAIASKAGLEPRTLRSALRDGEAAAGGPLRELHVAELSTRSLRPWGSTSGARVGPLPDTGRLTEGDFERLVEDEPNIGRESGRQEGGGGPRSKEEKAPTPDDIAHQARDVAIDGINGVERRGPTRMQARLAEPAGRVRSGIARKRGKAPGLTPGVMEQMVFAVRYGASISQARGRGRGPSAHDLQMAGTGQA